jgi:hypothetical protein
MPDRRTGVWPGAEAVADATDPAADATDATDPAADLSSTPATLNVTCRRRQRPQTSPVSYASDTNRRCRWRR